MPEDDGAIEPAAYYIGGRSGAPGSGETAWAQLWNGQGSGHPLTVFFLSVRAQATSTNVGYWVERTTTRGTVGTSLTPDSDNHVGDRFSPSGITLDLDWSVQPTFAGQLIRTTPHMVLGGGLVWFVYGSDDMDIDTWTPIVVPDGEGLCVRASDTFTNVLVDVTFGFGVG